MLRLPAEIRVFFAMGPCDMRRQMDGLAALVRSGMERDPKSGDLYLFRNRRGDMIKALFFDRHGYCLLAKRVEKGTFRIDAGPASAETLELSATELARLLSELTLARGPSTTT